MTLLVTIDVFSGRPNPQYVLSGSDAQELLRDAQKIRGAVKDASQSSGILGFRGVVVQQVADDTTFPADLPTDFRIGASGSADDGKAMELAERLVQNLSKHTPVGDAADYGDSEGLKNFILDSLEASQGTETGLDRSTGTAAADSEVEDVTCQIERGRFNPGFWNAPDVIRVNNCYNYASNRRTNTFAQPGKGAGQIYTALTCPEVTRAALADGCHKRYDCFPATEKNRWLMALVVAPGVDYHWYRQHTLAEGFWGHKPGGTQARNTDNSGRVITNPQTCDRGRYTSFCGYFYSCRTQQNRIR